MKRAGVVLSYLDGVNSAIKDVRDRLEVLPLRCYRSKEFPPDPDETIEPTYSTRFYPVAGEKESIIAIAKEDGTLLLEDVRTEKTLGKSRIHPNAIFDLDWSDNGKYLSTASGDKSLCVLDASTLAPLRFLQNGHDRSVKTLEFSPGSDSLIASGSRDNSVLLWDLRNSDPLVNRIKNAHVSKEQRSCSVTSIKFLDQSHLLVTAGDLDGVIKVWDLRKTYSRYKKDPIPSYTLPHPGGSFTHGFTSLAVDSSNTLFVSCMDHKIYRYNLVNFDETPINIYTGYENKSFFVRIALSPDGEYLTSGSSDSLAYIWRVNSLNSFRETSPLCKLKGHTTEVTCVEWCKGGWTLVTCSDDFKHWVWTTDIRNSEDVVGSTSPVKSKAPLTPVSRESQFAPNAAITPTNVTPSTSASKRSRAYHTPGKSTGKQRKFAPSILNFFGKEASRKRSCEEDEITPQKRSNIENTPPKINTESNSKLSLGEGTSSIKNIKLLLDDIKEEDNITTPMKFERYPCSPSKMLIKTEVASPRKLNFSPLKAYSPTANLPNLVVDGKTPTSSSKKRSRQTDWLTSLSRQKKRRAAKKL